MFSVFQSQNASNMVQGVDMAFYVIFGISIFFLVGITTLMIYFVIRYNHKRHPKAEKTKDITWLEVTWTLIPLAIVLLMFFLGYYAFVPMRNAPKDAMIVKVTGRMWAWEFEYPGGKVSDTLVLPINKPVRLNLYSADVLHGFFIPAFRVKEDVVPGKDNFMWFIPQQLGTYEILCTAYCGLRHSYMESRAVIVEPADYEKWLAALPVKKMGEPEGLAIVKNNACLGCHSLDGTKLVGPSFKGLFGKTETVLADGKTQQVTADSAYIIESILEPDKKVVQGFNKGLMKSYKGVIKDEDLVKIFRYFKEADAK